MSRTPVVTLHVFKCDRCNALAVSRDPPDLVMVHLKRCSTRHFVCIACVDEVNWMAWREEWGPCPSRLQHRREVGCA